MSKPTPKNEPWRDGEHCRCRFNPHSNKAPAICQYHQLLAESLVKAETEMDVLKKRLEQLQKDQQDLAVVCDAMRKVLSEWSHVECKCVGRMGHPPCIHTRTAAFFPQN